jgi:hypothetical protein
MNKFLKNLVIALLCGMGYGLFCWIALGSTISISGLWDIGPIAKSIAELFSRPIVWIIFWSITGLVLELDHELVLGWLSTYFSVTIMLISIMVAGLMGMVFWLIYELILILTFLHDPIESKSRKLKSKNNRIRITR